MTGARRTILWVAEAVTLAHVARPLAALRTVDAARWQSVIAADLRVRHHFTGISARFHPLPTIDPDDFLHALRRGAPVYDTPTLHRYVDADLSLLREAQPDLVIGDFRLSLAVSARLARIPYATIASACWSPHYRPPRWPVPALTLTRSLPLPVAHALFRAARPIAFQRHAVPMNRLRREYGLPVVHGDVRDVYTDADYVLYTDLPELFPAGPLPANQWFVGPALWEPAPSAPWSWPDTAEGHARVYVTLGSSGAAELLPKIIEALRTMPVAALVATAWRAGPLPAAPNVRVAASLPGIEVAKSASVVVCNGGTLTCYQALSAGVPVVGIPSNLEQFLTCDAVERVGAAVTVRADRFSTAAFRIALDRALNDASVRRNAGEVARWCEGRRLEQTIPAFLRHVDAVP